MTYREYLLAADGYNRNERAENGRIRVLAYTMARPYLKDENMSPYEFWPLDGDPTLEEINQEQQDRLDREMEKARETRDRILKKHKAKMNGGV